MSMTEYSSTYSIEDDLKSALKVKLPIMIESKRDNINVRAEILVDTGATAVTLSANSLGIKMTENEFINRYKIKPTKRFGINNKYPIIYYKYLVEKLVIGNIVLHNFPVYITFDENCNSNLLGMSFLRLFELRIRPQFKEVSLKATSETEDDIRNNISMHNVDKKYLDTLIDMAEFNPDSADEQTLEANIINKKLNT